MHHKSHVSDWMTRHPITVTADTSLIGAYDVMRKRSVRRLPVVDESGKLIGIITQSDIQQVLPFAQNKDARTDAMFAIVGMTVGEIMTRDPVTVTPTQPIQDVAQCMIQSKISGLPVVDGEQLAGIITESDIFQLVVQSWNEAEERE